MNVENIKIQAELNNEGMEIQLQYALRFINECISVLSNQYETACKKEKTTISAIAGEIIDLPTNFIAVKKIEKENNKYSDFEVFDNQIEFKDDGDYVATYLRSPNDVTIKTETPEINKAYHYAIALFVASREKNRVFGAEDSESQRLRAEFFNQSTNADINLVRQNRTRRYVSVPYWG